MKVIVDLEVHSKYARAVSSSMDVPTISDWAEKKGIDLVGTGDFTHPSWLRELETNLVEAGQGIFKINKNTPKTRFLLTSEVSCMYKHEDKGRRVHLLVYFPSFASVKNFNKELTLRGCNLFSDGRPIIGLSLAQVAEIALGVDKKALIIPAHVWTPWFGFYGHMSGYDSLTQAFGKLEKYIPAIETGLSSDPAMNWKMAELTNRRIVSFGDAHSPQKLGREATVLDVGELSYDAVGRALWGKGPEKISHTIEFYPEEGKYHYTGHRNCGVVYSPNETRKMGMGCPVCGKVLTMGVMSRVESLSSVDIETSSKTDEYGVRWVKPAGPEQKNKSPYVMLVPLLEILSESLGFGVGAKRVANLYDHLTGKFGSEFNVLLRTSIKEIEKTVGEKIAEGISRVRSGDIVIKPGYDGVFGKVSIWKGKKAEDTKLSDQTSLF